MSEAVSAIDDSSEVAPTTARFACRSSVSRWQACCVGRYGPRLSSGLIAVGQEGRQQFGGGRAQPGAGRGIVGSFVCPRFARPVEVAPGHRAACRSGGQVHDCPDAAATVDMGGIIDSRTMRVFIREAGCTQLTVIPLPASSSASSKVNAARANLLR